MVCRGVGGCVRLTECCIIAKNTWCYTQILCGGSVKILDIGYFVLIWFGGKLIKTRNPEADLQRPVHLDRTANCLINYQIG